MVAVVTVAVLVVLVTKVLVWAEAANNMLVEDVVIDVLAGVDVDIVAVVMTVSEFIMPNPFEAFRC